MVSTRPMLHRSTGPKTGGNRSLTLAAMSLGFVVVQLDVTIVNVALQAIGSALGGGIAGLQWVVSAYTIAFAALILTAGAAGDRYGAKRVFMAGFAVFVLASLGCAVAPAMGLLIVARALQGLGAAILVPCSLALLNHAYPDEPERTDAIGIWAAGASAALAAGPVVGGALIAAIGWRSIFIAQKARFVPGMHIALLISGVVVLLGCLLALLVHSGEAEAQDQREEQRRAA